jgi:hypothetical protein
VENFQTHTGRKQFGTPTHSRQNVALLLAVHQENNGHKKLPLLFLLVVARTLANQP